MAKPRSIMVLHTHACQPLLSLYLYLLPIAASCVPQYMLHTERVHKELCTRVPTYGCYNSDCVKFVSSL